MGTRLSTLFSLVKYLRTMSFVTAWFYLILTADRTTLIGGMINNYLKQTAEMPDEVL